MSWKCMTCLGIFEDADIHYHEPKPDRIETLEKRIEVLEKLLTPPEPELNKDPHISRDATNVPGFCWCDIGEDHQTTTQIGLSLNQILKLERINHGQPP